MTGGKVGVHACLPNTVTFGSTFGNTSRNVIRAMLSFHGYRLIRLWASWWVGKLLRHNTTLLQMPRLNQFLKPLYNVLRLTKPTLRSSRSGKLAQKSLLLFMLLSLTGRLRALEVLHGMTLHPGQVLTFNWTTPLGSLYLGVRVPLDILNTCRSLKHSLAKYDGRPRLAVGGWLTRRG